MRLCPFLHRIGRHTVLANRDLSSRLMLPQSAIFNGEGELSAAIELRRRFPGLATIRRRGRALGPSPGGHRCRSR